MKNFPHQINELQKLHRALGVFATLIKKGADADDDGIVGVALARKRVYQFRDKSLSLQQALQRERAKPAGSQGTRTCARDLRRFFLLTGLLKRDLDGGLRLTPLGERLLASDGPNTDQASQVWRTVLSSMAVGQNREESHPYALLLRLVADRPGIKAPRLALALEARNDSEDEYARILALADRADWQAVLRRLRISQHQARNATKILPALARQLGDIREDRGGYYPTGRTPTTSRRHRAPTPRRRSRPARSRRHRRVGSTEIAAIPLTHQDREPREDEYKAPWETAAKRRERLRRHQQLVRDFAALLARAAYELHEDPFDILATKATTGSVLVEAKTLEESGSDEAVQVRATIGQLNYYEYLEVPADARARSLLRIALFERPITEPHIALLESLRIIVLWRANGTFELPPWSREQAATLNLLL